jgi:hypothetical protein
MDDAHAIWLSEERGRLDRWLLRGTFGLALLLGTVSARAYEVQLALLGGTLPSARATSSESMAAYAHLGRQALLGTTVMLAISLGVFALRSQRGRLYLRREGARQIVELFPRPREALLRGMVPIAAGAFAAAAISYCVHIAPRESLVASAFAPHRYIGPFPWITVGWLVLGALLGTALRPRGATIAPDGIEAPTVFGTQRFEWGELRRSGDRLVAARDDVTIPVFVSTLRGVEERPEIKRILAKRLAERDAAWVAAEATLAPLEAVRRASAAYRKGAPLGDERRTLVAALEAGTAPRSLWRRAIAALTPADGASPDDGSFEAIPLLARLSRSALDGDLRREAAAALATFAKR